MMRQGWKPGGISAGAGDSAAGNAASKANEAAKCKERRIDGIPASAWTTTDYPRAAGDRKPGGRNGAAGPPGRFKNEY
jgi:hypothetical protein